MAQSRARVQVFRTLPLLIAVTQSLQIEDAAKKSGQITYTGEWSSALLDHEHASLGTSRVSMTHLGHVTMEDRVEPPLHEETKALVNEQPKHKEDPVCPTETYKPVDVPPPDDKKQPESRWWRLRIEEPCHREITKKKLWDVYSIDFYGVTCDTADEGNIEALAINKSWSSNDLDEGEVSETAEFNKQLAFDGDSDTHWRGFEEEGNREGAGTVWIAAQFAEPVQVRCVKFIQCDCRNSVRWAALEFNRHYDNEKWDQAFVRASIKYGSLSKIEVKPVDEVPDIDKGWKSIKDWFHNPR